MAKFVIIDEVRLTLYVPKGMPREDSAAVRRTIDSARFRASLRRALTAVMRKYQSLSRVRDVLSR